MGKDDVVNLALRRSLFFPSAEIYSSAPSGFWDFGPFGHRIRRKIVDFWRKEFVEKEGFLEISGAQILPRDVFKASGHLDNFNDPVVRCRKCQSVFRADQLISEATSAVVPESISTPEFDALIKKHKLRCPSCKAIDFDETKKFNMMMKLDIGATGKQEAYLRPETCQSIFLAFDRLYKTMRQQLPLGIAQSGASFRNEISPRNTLLRERELGQMEIEVFFNPLKENEVEKWESVKDYKLRLLRLKEKNVKEYSCMESVDKKIVSSRLVAYLLCRTQQFYAKLGVPLPLMRFRELEQEARAFYAKETWDFEVETSLGWVELAACNHRSDYDLKSHSAVSKHDHQIKDLETGKEFFPNVFEISAGLDRSLFVLLDVSLKKEKRGPEERIFLSLNPSIAPYVAGVFPLVNKDGLNEKAREVFGLLKDEDFDVFFDDKGSIGKRYARGDEIGVFGGITVDYDSMKDGTVTFRFRDSMAQERVKIADLPVFLKKAVKDYFSTPMRK
ncbi:MAG: glycine--tRNA ligase [archaeon]|nr:glycine--tRNA ligase [archaeon]